MPEKKKTGRPRSRTGKEKMFLLRLQPELHQRLRLYAAANELTMTAAILALLEKGWAAMPDRGAYERLVTSD